jgi:thioredoxin-dependent adenylylsulfate APS reductase
MPEEIDRTTIATAGRLGFPPDAEDLDASAVLALALHRIGRDRLVLVSSFGVEDMVLLDLLVRLEPRPRVVTLDTGRLPEETYAVMEAAREQYAVDLEIYAPDAAAVEELVRRDGPNLMYQSLDNRLSCCEIRKVRPLNRALSTADGWITGVRRGQTPSRKGVRKLAVDLEHGLIWKAAPLADWTSDQVWDYVRRYGVPYNALHDAGFPSIGCAPCTRAVGPGDDPRSGRWWWEQDGSRECGLHVPKGSTK